MLCFLNLLALTTAPSFMLKTFVEALSFSPNMISVVRNSVPVPETVASLKPFVPIRNPPFWEVLKPSVSFVPPVCTKSPLPPKPARKAALPPEFRISKRPPVWRKAP